VQPPRCKVLLQTILERKRRSKIEPPDVLDLSKRFSGIGESDPSEALDQLHGESNHPEALEQLQRVWRVWLLSPALQQHIRDGTVTEDMMNVAIDLYDKAVDLYRYDKAINPGGEDWTGGISASPTRRVSLLWNRTPYAERGWCTFERGCASMVVTHIESAIKLKETDADASSNPESSIPKVLRSAEGSRDKLVDITWAGDHTSLRSEESVTKLRALSRPVKDLRAIARAIEESKFTNEADKTAVAQMLFGLEWMMHEAMENVLAENGGAMRTKKYTRDSQTGASRLSRYHGARARRAWERLRGMQRGVGGFKMYRVMNKINMAATADAPAPADNAPSAKLLAPGESPCRWRRRRVRPCRI